MAKCDQVRFPMHITMWNINPMTRVHRAEKIWSQITCYDFWGQISGSDFALELSLKKGANNFFEITILK